ncbi:MAG: DUF4230 domain-containing protein [Lachnospiraceae bacterium]|nr:DUF4230 domain-containing protein [Lachnospiraceae bacterium]
MKIGGQKVGRFALALVLLLCGLAACGSKEEQATEVLAESGQATETTQTVEAVPRIDRIKQICELVVVECEYHNVAKSKKSPGIGPEHIGEKERTFWIEYTGKAQIYYRVDKISMEQDGTELVITLPRPSVSCTIDENSWNEDSYVISPDQWLQKNPITAEDQTKAVSLAQAEMVGQIRGNSSLMNSARMQVQELVKNYVNQIGEATGVTYHITWKDAEN